jgi:hypothetical protein
MAQDRFINITLDPNTASHADKQNDRHGEGAGSAAAGDLTISYDSVKFTSLSTFRSAINGALNVARQSMKA